MNAIRQKYLTGRWLRARRRRELFQRDEWAWFGWLGCALAIVCVVNVVIDWVSLWLRGGL